MKLKVLGSYGSTFLNYRSVAFAINDVLLIDAGSTSSFSGIGEIAKIRYAVISHAHLDHIKAIPFMAEQLMAAVGTGLEILGTEETLRSLREHIFNGTIWPDLSKLPTPQTPAIKYTVLSEEETAHASGLSIKAISVNHTIPASGFLISDNGSTILYSGDTGPTEKLWIQANNATGLKALLIEVSFPDRLKELAAKTMHLTPSLMVEELKKVTLTEDVMILPYHFKPPYVDEIIKELSELKMNNLIIIKDGDIFEI